MVNFKLSDAILKIFIIFKWSYALFIRDSD